MPWHSHSTFSTKSDRSPLSIPRFMSTYATKTLIKKKNIDKKLQSSQKNPNVVLSHVVLDSSVKSERRLAGCSILSITYLSHFIHAECYATVFPVPNGCSSIADGKWVGDNGLYDGGWQVEFFSFHKKVHPPQHFHLFDDRAAVQLPREVLVVIPLINQKDSTVLAQSCSGVDTFLLKSTTSSTSLRALSTRFFWLQVTRWLFF